ncbi:hypothetical protein Vadar_018945 [Vaccinium darrowii]|uniref:Uncharacterized protein n=1 Tax=Vaccinium darrowii TaxID=229202 RepID=A0ACB7Y095_9ERIC|nr:hypothetical protein Vadar_018945 [Vaccinium darrowii]
MGTGVCQPSIGRKQPRKSPVSLFICVMFQQFFPDFLRRYLETLKHKFVSYFFPSIQMISFHEYCGSKHKVSEVYSLIESYLSSKSPTHSDRIISELVKKRESLVLTMDAREEIIDVFDDVVVKWFLKVTLPMSTTISWHPNNTEKNCYELTFHSKDRKVVTSRYLDYVMSEGREIAIRNRQQRIYTNNPNDKWWDYKKNMRSHVVFKAFATFKSLAFCMVALKLVKSTMIAAMANYLNYDIYNFELTAVGDNTEPSKLASVIPSKSIVVIEDIDCSLDLSGRKGKK